MRRGLWVATEEERRLETEVRWYLHRSKTQGNGVGVSEWVNLQREGSQEAEGVCYGEERIRQECVSAERHHSGIGVTHEG